MLFTGFDKGLEPPLRVIYVSKIRFTSRVKIFVHSNLMVFIIFREAFVEMEVLARSYNCQHFVTL